VLQQRQDDAARWAHNSRFHGAVHG
jgi:hypothetical protein